MDYNITLLEDLPDIDEIETQKNLMQNQHSMIPDTMYNKFKSNLRVSRELPSEAGMNTVKYIGNYTPIPPYINSQMSPMQQYNTQQPMQYMQYNQNQTQPYFVQQPLTTENYSDIKTNDEIKSTVKNPTQNCDCIKRLRAYLIVIIVLLVIFILLMLYFLRVLNFLMSRLKY